MNEVLEVKITDIRFKTTEDPIQGFVEMCKKEGLKVSEHQECNKMTIRVEGYEFEFMQHGCFLRLDKELKFYHPALVMHFKTLLLNSNACATLKHFAKNKTLIEYIEYGEIVKIIEMTAVDEKVVFEKHRFDLKILESVFSSTYAEERIEKIQQAIDVALINLHQAVSNVNPKQIQEYTNQLSSYHKQVLSLEMYASKY